MSKSTVNIVPLGDRVLLQPIEEEQKIGNLSVPETEKERESRKAKVIALGTGVDKKGKKVTFYVEADNVVLYRKYSGEDIEIDGVKYVIISQDDIVAIVK